MTGIGLAGRQLLARRRADDLRDAVVVVTGSSRGLGLILAREFARQGARLVLCGRDERSLERARGDVAELGIEVLAVPCDVGDRGQVEALVSRATERFGRVDVLVNNAGIITVGPVETQTVEDFERAMAVMFWGVVHPTLAVLPQMLERGRGSIVNVTSIGGKVSAPHLLPYCCAKFAAVAFSEGLRGEMAAKGVSVLTVVPGFMRTGSTLNAAFKGDHRGEFAWFHLAGNLPIVSMNAERAARRIVSAAVRRRPELILTPPAQLGARFADVAPGATAVALDLFNRLLPKPDGAGRESRLGKESRTPASSSFLTALGTRAAQAYHQDEGHQDEGHQDEGHQDDGGHQDGDGSRRPDGQAG